jgi:hypothetical protein
MIYVVTGAYSLRKVEFLCKSEEGSLSIPFVVNQIANKHTTIIKLEKIITDSKYTKVTLNP